MFILLLRKWPAEPEAQGRFPEGLELVDLTSTTQTPSLRTVTATRMSIDAGYEDSLYYYDIQAGTVSTRKERQGFTELFRLGAESGLHFCMLLPVRLLRLMGHNYP